MSKKTNKSKKILNSAEILKREEQFIECYRKYNGKGLRILLGLYKGDYDNLFLSSLFFVVKSIPEWVLPLITADVINLVIARPDNFVFRLMLDLIIALVVLLQNIPTHMLHSHFFSKAKRRVEAGLRGAEDNSLPLNRFC